MSISWALGLNQDRPKRMPVGVATFIQLNRLWLVLRRAGAHGEGLWATPGGWVELGEDPVDTVIRECKEEVGIKVQNPIFINYTHDIFPEGVEDVCLWFYVPTASWSGHPRIMEPQKATDLKWMTGSEVLNLKEAAFGGSERMSAILEEILRDW